MYGNAQENIWVNLFSVIWSSLWSKSNYSIVRLSFNMFQNIELCYNLIVVQSPLSTRAARVTYDNHN